MARLDILKKVRELIVEHPEMFDYSEWPDRHQIDIHCGTPACVGGWCEFFLAEENPSNDFSFMTIYKKLGLTKEENYFLFYPAPVHFRKLSEDSYLHAYQGDKEFDYGHEHTNEKEIQEALNRIDFIIAHYSQE